MRTRANETRLLSHGQAPAALVRAAQKRFDILVPQSSSMSQSERKAAVCVSFVRGPFLANTLISRTGTRSRMAAWRSQTDTQWARYQYRQHLLSSVVVSNVSFAAC